MPGNTSRSSSPLASWEGERPLAASRISHTLAGRIQFDSTVWDLACLVALLHGILEPINEPLELRFRQPNRAVFHLGCPKGPITNQAA